MTSMEQALIRAGLVVPEPPKPKQVMQCKDCARRRNDGFCPKIKKHRARRQVACTKFRPKGK